MISVIMMQLQYAFSYYALESFKEHTRTYVQNLSYPKIIDLLLKVLRRAPNCSRKQSLKS